MILHEIFSDMAASGFLFAEKHGDYSLSEQVH